MDKRELRTDELDEVAGGAMVRPGSSLGPFIPPSTGPTIPVEPPPVIVYL